MPKRIGEDRKQFIDVISGRTRRELKRRIKNGSIIRQRPKGGKLNITIPHIETPRFLHGDSGEGVGRGPGKEGDVVGRDPKPGDGKGSQAGDQPGEGITIAIDMDDVLKFMQDELKLPEMKPKPNEVYEEIKIKYNDISKVGPESLRHTRRTMLEAIKRLATSNELDKLHKLPGASNPMKLITPINSDRRYRQFNEIKIPSSNAVIFFARDCSASMDDYRCDIVSDMSWWIDCWIRKFYKRVERCYFVHDTRATEVNEEEFYSYRYGGGTQCSSAFRAIANQLENRFPPESYNVYLFYFTDGDNWDGDNGKIVDIINKELGPEIVNMIGITQVCSWRYDSSVKHYIDERLKDGSLGDFVRTSYIGPNENESSVDEFGFPNWGNSVSLTDDDRDTQIIDAIREILGKENKVTYEA